MYLPIILSKNKVEELKNELTLLENSLRNEQHANLGIVHASYKEAAADEIVLKAKEKRVNELKFPNGEIKKVKLVHPIEADPNKNLISIESPIIKDLK